MVESRSRVPGHFALDVSERVNNCVLWPDLGDNVPELVFEFQSFVHDIVPGVATKLFRAVCDFDPTHVM